MARPSQLHQLLLPPTFTAPLPILHPPPEKGVFQLRDPVHAKELSKSQLPTSLFHGASAPAKGALSTRPCHQKLIPLVLFPQTTEKSRASSDGLQPGFSGEAHYYSKLPGLHGLWILFPPLCLELLSSPDPPGLLS